MADAIIPVPIYDPAYISMANLILNAKEIMYFHISNIPYGTTALSNGSVVNIGKSFNTIAIIQASAGYAELSYYFQSLPIFIIPTYGSYTLPLLIGASSTEDIHLHFAYTESYLKITQEVDNRSANARFILAILS